jgi:ATP-dependent DNA ligase
MDHVDGAGHWLFDKACELELEGIVAKRKTALYRPTDKPSPHWIKIKNRTYSQKEGRNELFEELVASNRVRH